MGKIGNKASPALPVIFKFLDSQDEKIKRYAIKTLGHIGGVEALDKLVELLRSDSELSRAESALSISKMGKNAKPAIPDLIIALGDNYPGVRHYAAEALGYIGPEAIEALPALIRNLEDEYYFASSYAAWAIGMMGPSAKEAIPSLIESFNSPGLGGVNTYKCGAIVGLGTDAIPYLIKALESEEKVVVLNALFTIGIFRTSGKAAIMDLLPFLYDDDDEILLEAILAISNIETDNEQALSRIVEIYRTHDNEDVRNIAYNVIERAKETGFVDMSP